MFERGSYSDLKSFYTANNDYYLSLSTDKVVLGHSTIMQGCRPKDNHLVPRWTGTRVSLFSIDEEDAKFFYMRPDYVVGEIAKQNRIDPLGSNCHHAIPNGDASNLDMHDEGKRIEYFLKNARQKGGVIVYVEGHNNNYHFNNANLNSVSFRTVRNSESVPSYPNFMLEYRHAYMVHIPREQIRKSLHGVFVPHIGYTVGDSKYYLRNRMLDANPDRVTIDANATGYYSVLDCDPTLTKCLWYRDWTGAPTQVHRIENDNWTNKLYIYKLNGDDEPELVVEKDVRELFDEPVCIEEGGYVTYERRENGRGRVRVRRGATLNTTRFFRTYTDLKYNDELEQAAWEKEKQAIRDEYVEKLKAEQERADRAEQARAKAERDRDEARQRRTETKDSLWQRTIAFLAGIVPALFKFVKWASSMF